MHREGETFDNLAGVCHVSFHYLGNGRWTREADGFCSSFPGVYTVPYVNPIRCSRDANLCTERRQDLIMLDKWQSAHRA